MKEHEAQNMILEPVSSPTILTLIVMGIFKMFQAFQKIILLLKKLKVLLRGMLRFY